ncbi:MAG: tyrosine-type recombinase/integrase, partial [bacterium]|nr:tyrosine-type recombinase/integrase [bacterium]
MASVYKTARSKFYQIEWYDHTGKRRTKSSKTTDYQAAVRIANNHQAAAALRREGVIDARADSIAQHGQRAISEQLDAFAAHQRQKSGVQHVAETRKFIDWIAEHNGWRTLRDIDADGVNIYCQSRLDDGRSARTVGSYVTAIKTFTRWCVKTGRLAADPLATVSKPNPESDRRVHRRALDHDEWRWIDAMTRQSGEAWGMTGQERAMLYALAIQTGLRSREIEALTRGKLNLTASPPFVVAKTGTTKNKKQARQYIQPELAAELREYVATKTGRATVFHLPPRENRAEMLREDAARARAAWLESIEDTQERLEASESDFLASETVDKEILDFHCLRHTCATWLIQSGADIKTVQSVLRHSDIKLTL